VRSSREALPIGATDTVLFPRVLFDASGAVIDTAGWQPYLPRAAVPPAFVTAAGGRFQVPPAPNDEPLLATLDDGYAIVDRSRPTTAEPAAFRVTRLDLEGDTVFHRRIRYTPRSYDDAALDTLALRFARLSPTGAPPRADGSDLSAERKRPA